MPKPKSPPDFETALTELEAIVSTMESGQVSLDDALSAYRRGVELLRHCQQTLSAAEDELRSLERPSLEDADSGVAEQPVEGS